MKQKIDEHDMTKKMMDIMRGGYRSLLKEDIGDEPVKQDDADTLTPKKGDAVFNDELKKLQDTVDPRVQIDNFKIYPNDGNVIVEGIFLKKEDNESGIKFRMALATGEIETSMNNIDLNDKVSILLQKLKGYYENWSDEWALKMANEYKPRKN